LEKQAMSGDLLKHILSPHAQALKHDFLSLRRALTDANDLQRRSLDILDIDITRLITLIDDLPTHHEPLSHDLRHDLRNRLTVIIGYAQIMMHRRAGTLTGDTLGLLQKIISMSHHINTAIEHDKNKARSE